MVSTLFWIQNRANAKIDSLQIKEEYEEPVFQPTLGDQTVSFMNEFELNTSSSFLQASMGEAKSLYYFERPKNLELESSEIDMKVSKQADGFILILKSATLQKAVQLSASSMGVFHYNY